MKLLNKKTLFILFIFLLLLGEYTSFSPRYQFEYPLISTFKDATMNWLYRVRNTVVLTSPKSMRTLLPIDFSTQFKGHYGYFLLTPESGISVYSGPDAQTKKIESLPGLTRVRTLYMTPDFNFSDLQWVFIGHEETGHPIGWVSARQLVSPAQFNVVSEWSLNRFGFCKGEYCGDVSVTDTGFFANRWYAKGQGLFLRGQHEGKLFEYNGIIWVKKAKPDGWIDIFHLPTDGGQLKHESKYAKEIIRIFDQQARFQNFKKRKGDG